MKSRLARQGFITLSVGILLIGSLITLVALQFKTLSDESIYSHVAQLKVVEILNTQNQSVNELKRRLEAVPGFKVQIENVNHAIMSKHSMDVFQISDIKAPFNWNRPLLLNYHDQLILIRFSPNNIILFATIGYSLLILLLVALGIYLCYWIISRLDKFNSMAQNALHQLSNNVYASINLPLDHSEAVNLHNEIQSIQNFMQRMLQKRTAMLAAISHDLKTPITRLKLRIELLKEVDSRQNLLKDISHLEHMVSSILSFSKDFIQEETAVRFNLSQLLSTLVEDLEDMGHHLTLDIQENILLHGRITALKRAFGNVLDNAVYYGKKGLKLSIHCNDKRVICCISDEGNGLEKDQYLKVFEPFYRVDTARSDANGSGLGLSITKEIIEAHGGSVKLMPNIPSGLVVEISLPVVGS